MPRKKAISQPPIQAAPIASPQNELAAMLTRLIQGSEPANERERFILFKWTHLSRQERRALAACWDLPCEQSKNEWIARKVEKDLNRQLRLNAVLQARIQMT